MSIYLYGAGGHSKVIRDILQVLGIKLLGIFDDDPSSENLKGSAICSGKLVLDAPLIISIGDNDIRAKIASRLSNVTYGKAIHSSAIISPTASIDEGSVVMQGAIVQASAKVGKHAVINTASSIDHDCVIGDFAHISPHVALCGNVHVGEGTLIGVGARIVPSIKIGCWCRIGAGAVVIRDVPDYATVVGIPARVIKIKNELLDPIELIGSDESLTVQIFKKRLEKYLRIGHLI
jgi:acetyltransferase EpsM